MPFPRRPAVRNRRRPPSDRGCAQRRRGLRAALRRRRRPRRPGHGRQGHLRPAGRGLRRHRARTLAGRHPAWVTIARNFLVEIGPPPVRPDRAVLQIKAYQRPRRPAGDSPELARSGYTIALDEYDGALIDNVEELMALCSIVSVDVSGSPPRTSRAILRVPKMQGAMLVATNVGDHAAFERCRARLHLLPGRVLRPAAHLQPPAASPPPASARCAASPSSPPATSPSRTSSGSSPPTSACR